MYLRILAGLFVFGFQNSPNHAIEALQGNLLLSLSKVKMMENIFQDFCLPKQVRILCFPSKNYRRYGIYIIFDNFSYPKFSLYISSAYLRWGTSSLFVFFQICQNTIYAQVA